MDTNARLPLLDTKDLNVKGECVSFPLSTRSSTGVGSSARQSCEPPTNNVVLDAFLPDDRASDCHGVRMGVGYLLNGRGEQAGRSSPERSILASNGTESVENALQASTLQDFGPFKEMTQCRSPAKNSAENKLMKAEISVVQESGTGDDKENDSGLANREGNAIFFDGPPSPTRNQLPNLEPLPPHSPPYFPHSSAQQRPTYNRDPLLTPVFTTSPATQMMGLLDPIESMLIPDGSASAMAGISGVSLLSPATTVQSNFPPPAENESALPPSENAKNYEASSAVGPSSDSMDSQRPDHRTVSEKEKSPSILTPRTIITGQGSTNMNGFEFGSTGFDALSYGSIIGFHNPDLMQPVPSPSVPSDSPVQTLNISNEINPPSTTTATPAFWSGNMALGNFGQASNATQIPNLSPTTGPFSGDSNFASASNHLSIAIQEHLAHLNGVSTLTYSNAPQLHTLPNHLNPLGNAQPGQSFNYLNLGALDQINPVAPISFYGKPASIPLGQRLAPRGAHSAIGKVKKAPTKPVRRRAGKESGVIYSVNGAKAVGTTQVGLAARMMMTGGRAGASRSCAGGPSPMLGIQAGDVLSNARVTAAGKKVFPCTQCGFVFGMRSNLKRHVSTVHDDLRAFRCEVCPASFGLKQNLVTHVRVKHERRRPFSCETCGQKFGYKQVLQNHIRNIHGNQ